ncbi:hypothetical protein V5O48_005135 [Marasmius crinis-equi]|uniref:Protein kinase domain-containing protein n=1 Tax=Marasmius crinis-equi TaxID=585013 RepID=A0ABR3FP38_9AGAR
MDPDVVTTQRAHTTRLADGKRMIDHYVLDLVVGRGQHGTVWRCHDHLNEDKIYAIKAVKRDNPKAKRERQYKLLRQQNLPARTDHVTVVDGIRTAEQEIRKEIAIMKKCRHPHVVRLYQVIDDRQNDQIFMVLEYLGGGEIHYTNGNNEPILTVEQTRRIMRDAILGLEYLHHQGIIHRDIKPANLIWTSNHDRVKIADFGTAHFSYAQRLAAAQAEGITTSSSDEDPMLLNDADLAKRAGSPAFLAPEVVWEYTEESNGPRPQVTKAIDIWALGVTLYCFLFGKTPFRPPGEYSLSEWTGYQCICNMDWRAPSKMGYDRVPTGGRHPPEEEVERGDLGPVIIHLLDHFLKKDVLERITLEEVKANRWFLLDLPNPLTWLEITSPNPIQVSPEEASDAMSTVRFRWNRWRKRSRGVATAHPSASASGSATGASTNATSATTPNRAVFVGPSNAQAETNRITTTTSPSTGRSSGSNGGGINLAKRLAALLIRSPVPSPAATPTSTSSIALPNPSSSHHSSSSNIFGIRMHRSQNALVAEKKGNRANKSKRKARETNDLDTGTGRSISMPSAEHLIRLRRVRSDRDAEAEREKREKRQRERERRKRKKREVAAAAADPLPATLASASRKGKGKEKEEELNYASKESAPSPSTPRPPTAPFTIPAPSAVHAPAPSRARSGSVRSLANPDQRAASPSGRRLTGLLSTITHWRPNSRGSHSGSPVDEKKDKTRDPKSSSSISSVRSKGTSESEIEFANPYRRSSTSPVRNTRPTNIRSETVPYPVPQPPQLSTSRSSSSAALFAPRTGAAGSRSGSTSPPVISPTFATAVMSGGVADVIPHVRGEPSSIGSTSSSSLGGLVNRRISSWDQGASADPDSTSLTNSYQSDDFDDDYDEDEHGTGVRAVDYSNFGQPYSSGSVPARPGGGGIIFMRDEVDDYSGSESDGSQGRDDQGTYEGTLNSTIEGPVTAEGSLGSGSERGGTTHEDDGLMFSPRKRRGG